MKKVILSLTLFVAAVGMASLVSCDNVDDYNSNIHDPEIPTAAIQTVNLNLPSGTLWANMNLGARTVYDYGNVYTWNVGIASQVWGSEWALPTREQVEELFNNCTWESFSYNGNNLIKGTSKNVVEGQDPAVIYISLTGRILTDRTAREKQGSCAYFWTSEENTDNTENAYYMNVEQVDKGTKKNPDLQWEISVAEIVKTTQNAVRCVKK